MRLKAFETDANFPIPTPVATVVIGTFDALNGSFVFGPEVERITETSTVERGHPVTITFVTSLVRVNAVRVHLQFNVSNKQGNFDIVLNEKILSAAPG